MFAKKPKRIQTVYLDNAAATPIDLGVIRAMQPFWNKQFANPSATYSAGVNARKAIDGARKTMADILHTQSDCILFTGSATESCNLAVIGVCRQLKQSKQLKHIITTQIEHHSVLEPIKKLEREGWCVTYLPVDKYGVISVEQFAKALRNDTVLVSIMTVNNEVGSVQPIADVGKILLKWRKENNTVYPYFHTDACQAMNTMPLDVEKLHVDLLTLNAAKINGPKGVGILYKRRGVNLEPLISGGGQEFGLRSGTENVSSIVGAAKAVELTQKIQIKSEKKLRALQSLLWNKIQRTIPDAVLHGPNIDDDKVRAPHILNVAFPGIEAEALVLYLDAYGIQVSSGSACASAHDESSYVLKACGVPDDVARASVRFSFGKDTKKDDIDYVMRYLPGIVKELKTMRELSKK